MGDIENVQSELQHQRESIAKLYELFASMDKNLAVIAARKNCESPGLCIVLQNRLDSMGRKIEALQEELNGARLRLVELELLKTNLEEHLSDADETHKDQERRIRALEDDKAARLGSWKTLGVVSTVCVAVGSAIGAMIAWLIQIFRP